MGDGEPRDRTDDLLKLLDIHVRQEHAIKTEENGWVRNHWAFYFALASLGVLGGRISLARFGDDPMHLSDQILLCLAYVLPAVVSLLATQFFFDQMKNMRWTYYGVRDRMLGVLRALRVDDASVWSLDSPLSEPVRLVGEIRDESP